MEENKYATNRDYGGYRFSQEEAKLLGQPDVLCVDEYLHVYRARPAETPERRLLSAILRDAIDCYIRDCCARIATRRAASVKRKNGFSASTTMAYSVLNMFATR